MVPDALLKMDFANKLIGGGVFGRGCVQEEIRFVVSPELLVCRLLAEQMERNECIIVTGKLFCSNVFS